MVIHTLPEPSLTTFGRVNFHLFLLILSHLLCGWYLLAIYLGCHQTKGDLPLLLEVQKQVFFQVVFQEQRLCSVFFLDIQNDALLGYFSIGLKYSDYLYGGESTIVISLALFVFTVMLALLRPLLLFDTLWGITFEFYGTFFIVALNNYVITFWKLLQ